MSKIDFSKLTSKQIAALDFRGDLRVRSRIKAGVVKGVASEALGGVTPIGTGPITNPR
jgi:hypothetical protein